MISRNKTLPVVIIICLAHTFSLAQDTPRSDSQVIQPWEQTLINKELDERLARDWGLRIEEWTRYRQLMQGPLGVYSPNLDPLSALGIEARNDEERRRYAELQVQAEARRVEKLLAYQRAYDAAWQRLYPDLQPVSLTDTDKAITANSSLTRLAVFVKESCPLCEQRVRQLQAQNVGFDLYLVGSEQEDTRVRQWAAQAGINPDKVRERVITLNHDAGRWQSIGVEGELPAVVREINGQWRRL